MFQRMLFALPLVMLATPALAAHQCTFDDDCDGSARCIGWEPAWFGSSARVSGSGICEAEWDYCEDHSCGYSVGDCDPGQCREGLTCVANVGFDHGYLDNNVDVCEQDWSYCSPSAPCDYGVGDCDRDSDCKPGLACGWDQGKWHGAADRADICVNDWEWWNH